MPAPEPASDPFEDLVAALEDFRRGVSVPAAEGAIDRDADLDVAVTMLTGSWYGRCLAGDREPEDWPRRVAERAWRALGCTTTSYVVATAEASPPSSTPKPTRAPKRPRPRSRPGRGT